MNDLSVVRTLVEEPPRIIRVLVPGPPGPMGFAISGLPLALDDIEPDDYVAFYDVSRQTHYKVPQGRAVLPRIYADPNMTAGELQGSIDDAANRHWILEFRPGEYLLTTTMFPRSDSQFYCPDGVVFTKNFYDGTSGAIFANQSFATKVDNFSIRGRPLLQTGPDGGGKLIFLKGDYQHHELALGSWTDVASDGFGIAVAGKAKHILAVNGDPQSPAGTAGVQDFGGSGRIVAIGLKSGDDAVGVFPIRQDIADVGGLDIYNLDIIAIDCESTGARVIGIGIAQTPAHDANPATIRNVHGRILGCKALSQGENAVGMAAVMIYCNVSRPQDQVSNCRITAQGIDCGGFRALRMFNVTDCAIHLDDAKNIGQESIVLNNTLRAKCSVKADLSGQADGINPTLLSGTNTEPEIVLDLIAPPTVGATLLDVGNISANPIVRGRFRVDVHEMRQNQVALRFGSATDCDVAYIRARKQAGVTGTIGVSFSASSVNCSLLSGDLADMQAPVFIGSQSARIVDGTVRGYILSGQRHLTVDADINLFPGVSARHQLLAGLLTADRTIHISTSGAIAGIHRFTITRTGAGAFNWIIMQDSTAIITTLAQNQWCEVVFGDGGNYYIASKGTLA